MAQGIKQGIFATFLASVPNIKGKDVANAVADCMAGKANSAILLLCRCQRFLFKRYLILRIRTYH